MLLELVGTEGLPVSTKILDLVLVLRKQVLNEFVFHLPISRIETCTAEAFMLASPARVAKTFLETTLVWREIDTCDNRCDLATATTVGMNGLQCCFSDDCGDSCPPGGGVQLDRSVLNFGELDLDLLGHGAHDAWTKASSERPAERLDFVSLNTVRMPVRLAFWESTGNP